MRRSVLVNGMMALFDESDETADVAALKTTYQWQKEANATAATGSNAADFKASANSTATPASGTAAAADVKQSNGAAAASAASLVASAAVASPIHVQATSEWPVKIAKAVSQLSSLLSRNSCSMVVSYFAEKYTEFTVKNPNAADSLAVEYKVLVLTHVNPMAKAEYIEYAKDFASAAKIQEVETVPGIAELINTMDAQVKQWQAEAPQLTALATPSS